MVDEIAKTKKLTFKSLEKDFALIDFLMMIIF